MPICPTVEPTAPLAAETTNVSPFWGLAKLCIPTYAVVPGIPKTPIEVERGAMSGSIILSFVSSTVGLSCHPVLPSTKSPTLKNFDLLSIT